VASASATGIPAPPRSSGRPPRRPRLSRRRRLLTRTGPLVLLAAASFAYGIYQSGATTRSDRALVTRYVAAWRAGDYALMYRLLDPAAQQRMTAAQFRAALTGAATTATLTSLRLGRVGNPSHGAIAVRAVIATRIFGTLHEVVDVPIVGGPSGPRVQFGDQLVFPGLRAGEQLHRSTVLGRRGALLADDGTPLAEGPDRTSPIPAVAGEIAGTLGPIPAGDAPSYDALGYPPDAKVGIDGLELVFQHRLAGRIGGTLYAGARTLASTPAGHGHSVRTTINPAIEQAAIDALGSSYAGMTVMDPRTGALLALAGIAFSDVQPPGSTMKIITSTGALQAGIAKLSTEYAYQSSANLDGYILHNASNEVCGGTLLNAFAVSCNSVFAPLGAQLGAKRLVATARRFGFDHPAGIPGALESTIPSAATIGDALAVGSSAIGQGKVLASTLEMADVGATIAMGGRRPIPTLRLHARARFVRVTPTRIARLVQEMMVAVVDYGTGTSAQISGVQVAGKTGTAELTNTANQTNATQETDAWFVGYAPVGKPRVVACALFPNAGYGAATAAPAVRAALEAVLATRY
jgi:beta-lactamase class D